MKRAEEEYQKQTLMQGHRTYHQILSSEANEMQNNMVMDQGRADIRQEGVGNGDDEQDEEVEEPEEETKAANEPVSE